jgi:hypothetical protein
MHYRVSRSFIFAALFSCCVALISYQLFTPSSSVHAATRDPLTWPFAPTSIWNMPIGSNARYVNAEIGSRGFGTDIDHFVVTSASDPLVPTYMPPTFLQGRCSGTTPQQQAQWHPEAAQPLHVPTNLIIPDAITSGGIYSTPNSSSAFLEPDGRTLVNFTTAARCQARGPLYGNWFGQSDLYGDGIAGGHGGSGMSSIGGSIRTGELLNDSPIRHALKIDLWGNWLHYDSVSNGRRWPAILADASAPQQYKGSNPSLVMGSLLALPPNVTAASLGITSPIGSKVFQALQNYGAYVVDTTGADFNSLCVEQNAETEFKNATGHAIEQDSALTADFNRMIAIVKVVDNNSPTSIGGGGVPRAPLAPAFGVPITQSASATTATSMPATQKVSTAGAKNNATSKNSHSGKIQVDMSGKPVSIANVQSAPTKKGSISKPTPVNTTPWMLMSVVGGVAILLGGCGYVWQRRRYVKT